MIDTIATASYADDNTCNVGKKQSDLEKKLQKTSVKLFKRFHENNMKVNQEKYQVFATSLDTRKLRFLKTLRCNN